MTTQNNVTARVKANVSQPVHMAIFDELCRLVVCTLLGIFGGSLGVALTLGFAVAFMQIPLLITIASNSILFTIVAVPFGIAISSLLVRGARHLLTSLLGQATDQNLQVVLIASALTTLMQVLFLTRSF